MKFNNYKPKKRHITLLVIFIISIYITKQIEIHSKDNTIYKIVSWVSTSTSAQRTNAAAVAQSLVGRRYSNPFTTGFNKWSYTQICSQVAYTAWIGNSKNLSSWWHPIVSPMIVFSNSTTVARWQ